MMRAVKAVSTYRGRDPRSFTLFAFGGSGPVLAAEVATQLQMTRIIVPPSPGLFSAFGLLFSKIEHEYVQTLFRRTGEVDEGEMERAYRALEEQARSALAADGFRPDQMSVLRQADLRYSGQAYELTIPVATPSGIAPMVEGFSEEHLRTYGHRADDEPVDLVNLRVVGGADPPGSRDIDPAVVVGGHGNAAADRQPRREAYFGAVHGIMETPVVGRSDFLEVALAGPLIVEEYDATTVVPPGWQAVLDKRGNIVMTKA
jgi:N-methylhydantoinase A